MIFSGSEFGTKYTRCRKSVGLLPCLWVVGAHLHSVLQARQNDPEAAEAKAQKAKDEAERAAKVSEGRLIRFSVPSCVSRRGDWPLKHRRRN